MTGQGSAGQEGEMEDEERGRERKAQEMGRRDQHV